MAATGPTTIALALCGPLGRADLPVLCERMRAVVEASGAEVVLCDVDGHVCADAVALDTLARLQLTARRLGSCLRLRTVPHELGDLLTFTGLGSVCGLVLEGERKAEEGEERLRVEEERELGDPSP